MEIWGGLESAGGRDGRGRARCGIELEAIKEVESVGELTIGNELD